MLPSVVIRVLTLALGFLYPAYKTFKCLQKRKPDVKEISFWCRYWTLLAVGATAEYFLDPFLFWLPMYPEAKLASVVFLWHPNTLGADYVYDRFFTPLMVRHEAAIDRHLTELQRQGQGMAAEVWRRGSTYAQVQFMELLAYLSHLSTEAARQAAVSRQEYEVPKVEDEGEVMMMNEVVKEGFTFVDAPVEEVGSQSQQDRASLHSFIPNQMPNAVNGGMLEREERLIKRSDGLQDSFFGKRQAHEGAPISSLHHTLSSAQSASSGLVSASGSPTSASALPDWVRRSNTTEEALATTRRSRRTTSRVHAVEGAGLKDELVDGAADAQAYARSRRRVVVTGA